jgi:hypothetical protein
MKMKTQTDDSSPALCNVKLKTCHARFLPLHTSTTTNNCLASFSWTRSTWLPYGSGQKDTLIHWNPGHAQTRWIGRFFTLDKIDNQHREPAQRHGTETQHRATAEQHQSATPHHALHILQNFIRLLLDTFLRFHKLTNSFSYYLNWRFDEEHPYRVQQSDHDQDFTDSPEHTAATSAAVSHPDQVFLYSLEQPAAIPAAVYQLGPRLQERHYLPAEMSAAVTLGGADVHMIDDDDNSDLPTEDDNVTEYSMTSEDYPRDSELEDSDEEDARSHISLSSTDEPEVPPVHDVDWKTLTPSQRMSYERMFGDLPQEPLNGSWNFTEDYQAELDQQCRDYNKIYPLEDWLIPPQEAQAVFNGVLERLRKRTVGVPIFTPGINMGQPRQQPFPFAQQQQQQQQQHYYQHQQQQQFQNGGMVMGMHPGPMRGTSYMPQGHPGIPRPLMMNDPNNRGFRNAPPTMVTRPPLKAPTPPYPTRERPDFRKTVGKSAGRGGKTRRQAETDEFPWNRQLDFIKAREVLKTGDTWDFSAYDKATIEAMNATRLRNGPVLAKQEMEITMKQSKPLHIPHILSCHLLTLYQSNHVTRPRVRAHKQTLRRAQKMTVSVMLRLSAKSRSRKMARVDCASKEAERRVVLLVKPAPTHITLEISPSLRRKTRNLRLRWACIHPKC